MKQDVTAFGGREVAKFDPLKTKIKIAGLSAAIKRAARIKDWATTDQGIEVLIREQRAFVAWWESHVTAEKGGDRRSDQSSKRATLIAETAAEITGINKFQVSRWRTGLKDVEVYTQYLRKVLWRGAWSAQGPEASDERRSALNLDAAALGKFVVILADPPWKYENPPMGGSNRSIENHYPTHTIEEISAMPVGDIAHESAVLFLWATAPKLPECLQVMAAWGFVHRTNMVWIKDKIGMGYYFRGRHEILLVGNRGEYPPPAASNRPDSVLEAPRGRHSEKPAAFHETIEHMYPEVTQRVELFARERRSGWAAWGNEV